MSYIIIDESGSFFKTNKVTEDNKWICDNKSSISIIDCKEVKFYWLGKWHELPKWSEWKEELSKN